MKVLNIMAFLCIVGILIWALIVGLHKTEKAECYKWQKMEQDYPLFEPSERQIEQCRVNGINLFEFVD